MRRRAAALIALVAVLATGAIGCGQAAPPKNAPSGEPRDRAATDEPRYVIGGDSRGDDGRVVGWAFHEATARAVTGLIYLGDMELSADLDDHFAGEIHALLSVPFYPVLGNHESARRAYGADAPRDARVKAIHDYRARFLGKPGTPVDSRADDRLTYAVDLPGGVHLVALDNVSQPGFGKDQLAWLASDLAAAHASGARHVLVAMHKALAGSGVTHHAMDEDGPAAVAESDAALDLCAKNGVELILASHVHGLAEYTQRGIRSFITGGLGAPLDRLPGKEPPTHHALLATVPREGAIRVEVLRFPGPQNYATEAER
jgi:hypothetical protein